MPREREASKEINPEVLPQGTWLSGLLEAAPRRGAFTIEQFQDALDLYRVRKEDFLWTKMNLFTQENYSKGPNYD